MDDDRKSWLLIGGITIGGIILIVIVVAVVLFGGSPAANRRSLSSTTPPTGTGTPNPVTQPRTAPAGGQGGQTPVTPTPRFPRGMAFLAPMIDVQIEPSMPTSDPRAFAFAAKVRDSDRARIVVWRWDLGDGGTAEGDRATHTYRDPGRYRVTCTVTDRDGQRHTGHRLITIRPPPPGPAELATMVPGLLCRVFPYPTKDFKAKSDLPIETHLQGTPAQTLSVASPAVDPTGRKDRYALQYQGHLVLAAEGTYRFSLHSDDFLWLLIDDELLAQSDTGQDRQATVKLAAGAHRFELRFQEHEGEEVLSLTIERQDGAAWQAVTPRFVHRPDRGF